MMNRMPSDVKIEASWKEVLKDEFDAQYFAEIKSSLIKAKSEGKVIYPPGSLIFAAFDTVPFDAVKVVILGQDPYHNVGEAMGLSFSVPKKVKIPPSLRNIFKELSQDLNISPPNHGDLTRWAVQGVFLLNSILTVEANRPASHSKLGWHLFTDNVIRSISANKENVVFLLWGKYAQSKAILIDKSRHLVLQSAHPSPLAGNAFFGNHHFSKTNQYLIKYNKSPIQW